MGDMLLHDQKEEIVFMCFFFSSVLNLKSVSLVYFLVSEINIFTKFR